MSGDAIGVVTLEGEALTGFGRTPGSMATGDVGTDGVASPGEEMGVAAGNCSKGA